jgi:hypothetical protein
VLWAIDYLQRTGAATSTMQIGAHLDALLERHRAAPPSSPLDETAA